MTSTLGVVPNTIAAMVIITVLGIATHRRTIMVMLVLVPRTSMR